MGSFVCLLGSCFVGFVLRFVFVDQSLRTSCLPTTILAQLRDCHSCYDERSIDQKKKAGFCGQAAMGMHKQKTP